MRRVVLLSALFALPLVAPAATSSHPGHGYLPVSIKNFAYNPQVTQAAQGDTVIWFWDGDDRNHSVTADAGQAEQFDSDPNGPPSQSTHQPSEGFQHQFTQVGTFTYYCKVHPTMKGRVEVQPLSGVAPPDSTPPAISRVTAKPAKFCTKKSHHCTRKGTVLTFTLGEQADLLVEIRRRRGKKAYGKVVDALDPIGAVGTNKVKVSGAHLKPGTYRISVIATDASGNSSKTQRVDVTVRR
jgi:plastocyanin